VSAHGAPVSAHGAPESAHGAPESAHGAPESAHGAAPGSAPSGPPGAPEGDVGAAADHDVTAVLRITPFRRLWLALGLSSFGDWLGLLATAAMAKDLAQSSYTAQNFAIAGVFILRLAPAVLLGPLAGALADRLERRWTLVAGDFVRFALFASIPLVGTLGWLFAATVLIECAALFWMPAKDATVPNLVPRRRLEAANQISLVATYGTAPLAAAVYAGLTLVSDALNGLMPHRVVDPISVALYFNALTFAVSALVIWRLDLPPSPGVIAAQRGVLGSIVDGWRFVGRTLVVRGLVTGMLGGFAAAGFVVGLSQTFVSDLGAGQPGFAVLFGSVFVGMAVGMWSGPRLLEGFSRRRLFGLSLVLSGVFLTLLALIPDIVAATFFVLVVGAGGGVAWVTGYTLLGLEVDDEVRGRTFAFVQSSARVVLVLVLAAGPALAAPFGTHRVRVSTHHVLTYSGAAAVFLLAGLLAVVMGITSFRQMDDRRGVPLIADFRAAWREPVGGALGSPAGVRQYPGLFLAFEGGDGAGKSTQARLLAEWLSADQGHDVLLTREPGGTPVGAQLRYLLLGHGTQLGARAEALLFAADRADHVHSRIRPALARGEIVISDRYLDSSIAYQGAGRELDGDEIARLSLWATDGLVPDLTVLLDLPIEIQRVRRSTDEERAGDDRLESLPDELHERIRQRFLQLARREPHRYLVLDASEPRDQLQAAIRARVRDLAPISVRRRAELRARLAGEEDQRRRRAAAESEVRRLDAKLRGRSRDEARARQESMRRAREEAEREMREQAGAASGPPDADGPADPDVGANPVPGPEPMAGSDDPSPAPRSGLAP
ncbi:MAG TPA: dTMP kinase, partial [Kineosporiaceae bacterium]